MIIIDVFNVLHASTKVGGTWRHRLNAADLRELLAASRWRSEQAVLVMDGTGGRSPDRTLRRSVDAGIDLPGLGGVAEIHAREGNSGPDADAVIESLLEREDHLGRGRLAVVVSSDKRVRAAAAGARAKSMTSEEFLRGLAEDVRKRHARAVDQHGGRPDFALDGGMDAGRTEYWMRELGVAPPPPPAHRSPNSGGGAASGAENAEECAPEINPDDVDMSEIMKSEGGKKPPPREDDDERGSKGKRRK